MQKRYGRSCIGLTVLAVLAFGANHPANADMMRRKRKTS